MPRGHRWTTEASRDMFLLACSDGRIARYRVLAGNLEYRASAKAPWVRLTPGQTLQHLAINTVVGEWLRARMADERQRKRTA
jgi:hypothetical protein